MRVYEHGYCYIESVDEFPNFIGCNDIFLDFETSSGSPKEVSTNPWQHCSIAGFAITADDCKTAYYFDWIKFPALRKAATNWLQAVLTHADSWINHHVKYDAHVATNYMGIVLPPHLQLVCTIVRAKLVDSDRVTRGGYGLDTLCKDWLEHDISVFEKRLQPYLGKANKDYGKIPGDILGRYACVDVIENRLLSYEINRRLPEHCSGVAATEIGVTRQLFLLEQHGLRFDPNELMLEQLWTINKLCQLDDELTRIVGRPINVKSSADCQELLCGHYGLPIAKFTTEVEEGEEGNASFDKHALKLYASDPYAPQDVISNITMQRKLLQRNSLYFVPWLEYAPDGILHSEYNQTVRTGRMSCKSPNAQQIDSFIKNLIKPRKGYSLFSTDASQIEFRFIVHYIEDAAAIAAYNADPDTDFHQFVADLCELLRKPAKTINFGTAFGEGKKKLISQLASDEGIIAAIKKEIDDLGLKHPSEEKVEFTRRITARGESIYDKYHATFAGLKATAKLAESVCKSRRLGYVKDDYHAYGYVTNIYGRDRHLPYCVGGRTNWQDRDPLDKAWLAFPTLNQSSAADLMKERYVELMDALYGTDIASVAVVHDEILLEVPDEIVTDSRFTRDVVGLLESPKCNLAVPIRWSAGYSNTSWNDASTPLREGGKSDVLKYDKRDCERFSWINA